jgi:hypothetical protein
MSKAISIIRNSTLTSKVTSLNNKLVIVSSITKYIDFFVIQDRELFMQLKKGKRGGGTIKFCSFQLSKRWKERRSNLNYFFLLFISICK